jgi:hypothetical protein
LADLPLGERSGAGSATATAARGFAATAGFATAARLAAATIPVEQATEAAQDAAATGLAARITAARFATAARLSGATTALFGRSATARLSGTAGLSGATAAGFFRTTTRGFAAAGLFAATIVVLVEQVEQAAAMAAAAVAAVATTTTTMAKEGRRASGAREHRGDAQDQRHQSNTNVHLETPTKTETGGKLTHGAPRVRTRRAPNRHVVSAALSPDVGSPHMQRTTLESSSCVIVCPIRRALLTR